MYFSTFIQWSTMQPLEKRSISLSTNMELRLRILLKENSKVQIDQLGGSSSLDWLDWYLWSVGGSAGAA